MATKSMSPVKTAQRALKIKRMIDAPRSLVWKALTDPEKIKSWWGPKDFTAPIAKINLRVGGKYLFCMRSPDGQDFIPQASIARLTCLNGWSIPIILRTPVGMLFHPPITA